MTTQRVTVILADREFPATANLSIRRPSETQGDVNAEILCGLQECIALEKEEGKRLRLRLADGRVLSFLIRDSKYPNNPASGLCRALLTLDDGELPDA